MKDNVKQAIRRVFDHFRVPTVWVDERTGEVHFNCQNSDCRQVTRNEFEKTKKQKKNE